MGYPLSFELPLPTGVYPKSYFLLLGARKIERNRRPAVLRK